MNLVCSTLMLLALGAPPLDDARAAAAPRVAQGRPTFTKPSTTTAPAAPTTAAPARAASLALLPLKATGLQLNEAQRLDVTARARLEGAGRFAVQDAVTTTKLLESAQGLGLDCDVNALACAIDVGQIADVDFVVLGAATAIEETVGLDLRLVDVRNGTEVRRVSGLIPKAASEMIAAANTVVNQLLEVSAPLARAQIRVVPEGARVVLNGTPRGETPLPTAIEGLAPGDHHLLVEKQGFLAHVTRFTLGPNEAAEIDVTLVADPKTIVEKERVSAVEVAIPFSIAGASAVALVGGGVAAGVGLLPLAGYYQAQSELDALDPSAPDYPEQAADIYVSQKGAYDGWTGWGALSTGIGATVAGIGVVVGAVGLSWGAYVLSVMFGEGTPTSTAPGTEEQPSSSTGAE